MILVTVLLASMTASSIHPRPSATDCLAPFPFYFTPLGHTKSEFVEVDGKTYEVRWSETGQSATFHEVLKVKGNGERPEPFIVKIKKYSYLIYYKGVIKIRHVFPGGEQLFDKFFKIPPPPEPPEKNGNGDDDDKPSRWDWKP